MIDQVFIGIFGLASIWLANDPREPVRRWACICGLLAQPFWLSLGQIVALREVRVQVV